MARRSLTAFLAAAVVAMMIGFRDSTGLAPPDLIIVEEEVHWLAPELDDDPDPGFELAEAPPSPEATSPGPGPSSEARGTGMLARWFRWRR